VRREARASGAKIENAGRTQVFVSTSFFLGVEKSGLYIRRCTQPNITEIKRTGHKRVKKAATGNQPLTKVNKKNYSNLY
jgi:hypothetical protein